MLLFTEHVISCTKTLIYYLIMLSMFLRLFCNLFHCSNSLDVVLLCLAFVFQIPVIRG